MRCQSAEQVTLRPPQRELMPARTRADDAGTSYRDPGASVEPPPCAKGSCKFDGVCYPDGATTEDGCCTCDSAGGSCLERAWCPGWILDRQALRFRRGLLAATDYELGPLVSHGLLRRARRVHARLQLRLSDRHRVRGRGA